MRKQLIVIDKHVKSGKCVKWSSIELQFDEEIKDAFNDFCSEYGLNLHDDTISETIESLMSDGYADIDGLKLHFEII